MYTLKWSCLSAFITFAVVSLVTAADDTSNSDDVGALEIEHYGADPCAPFSPAMPDFRAPGRRISEVKCYEYVWKSKIGAQEAQRSIKCDFIHGKDPVLGGREAKLAEFAHMGAMGWKAVGGNWIFKCGASLISNKFALTAAHCTYVARDTDIADPVPKIVRLGAKTITNTGPYKELPTDGEIKRLIPHNKYQSPQEYYDIALVEFVKEIPFKWQVHPACLYSSFDPPANGTVSGWGVVDLATLETSPTLQVADVSMIKSNDCDSFLEQWWNRKWRGLVRHQLCAGQLSGGVDTCQGDSGGPLQAQIDFHSVYPTDPNRWTMHRVIGVTSFGFGCGRVNSPGVYTRVASFINWIEKTVWPQNV